jgi:hypothetical protein
MGDGDTYALGWSYTRDDPEDHVTLVVLRARDERAPSPFRVLVQEVDFQSWTHTLREGGFDTVDDAMEWAKDRLSGVARPLPPVRTAGDLSPARRNIADDRRLAKPANPRTLIPAARTTPGRPGISSLSLFGGFLPMRSHRCAVFAGPLAPLSVPVLSAAATRPLPNSGVTTL